MNFTEIMSVKKTETSMLSIFIRIYFSRKSQMHTLKNPEEGVPLIFSKIPGGGESSLFEENVQGSPIFINKFFF